MIEPELSTKQRAMLIALGTALVLINFYLLLGAALGDCAPAPDGSGCENDGLKRFLMFPGFAIVSVAFMIWLVGATKKKSGR